MKIAWYFNTNSMVYIFIVKPDIVYEYNVKIHRENSNFIEGMTSRGWGTIQYSLRRLECITYDKIVLPLRYERKSNSSGVDTNIVKYTLLSNVCKDSGYLTQQLLTNIFLVWYTIPLQYLCNRSLIRSPEIMALICVYVCVLMMNLKVLTLVFWVTEWSDVQIPFGKLFIT